MQALTPEQVTAVEEFIEQLQSSQEQELLRHASALQSEPVFAAIWSNPEDDVYDDL
jgi:hypothetical protein